MSNSPIKVLLLAGSRDQPSHTRASLERVAGLLQEREAEITLRDLGEMSQPIRDPNHPRGSQTNGPDPVRRLAQLAEEADAFVWGTPVYHNSFSGVLKTALDSLSSSSFRHKPVALISNGGGVRGAVQPCDQLRIVARGLHTVAIPTQVVTTDADFALREGRYVLVNEAILERLVTLADELMAYAVLLRPLRKTPEERNPFSLRKRVSDTPVRRQ
jgi:NAD(P)H-dependent FMN reductase